MLVDGKRATDTRRQSSRGSEALRSKDVVDAERDAEVPGLQDLRLSSRACKPLRINSPASPKLIAIEIIVGCQFRFYVLPLAQVMAADRTPFHRWCVKCFNCRVSLNPRTLNEHNEQLFWARWDRGLEPTKNLIPS